MGDGDDRAARGEALEGGLYFVLGLGIEGACGLVEKEDGRILQQRAGNGQPLLLAAGDEAALVADDCLVALRLGEDEIVGVGLAGGLIHFLVCGIEPPVADVVHDALVKQKGVLADDAYALPQRLLREGAKVVAVETDRRRGRGHRNEAGARTSCSCRRRSRRRARRICRAGCAGRRGARPADA